MNVYNSRGKRIFEIIHWPFELPPNMHQLTSPCGWHKWRSLARPSKGQCTISNIISPQILYFTFSPETISPLILKTNLAQSSNFAIVVFFAPETEHCLYFMDQSTIESIANRSLKVKSSKKIPFYMVTYTCLNL